MPQVPKEEVRARIVEAALSVFASRGYAGATMPEIAERAGVATGNVYRYFQGKEALFRAAVPDEIAGELLDLLVASARSFAGPGADGHATREGEALLRFWLDHRLAVVVLLEHTVGTPHEGFGDRFVALLVESTLAELHDKHPELRVSRAMRLVLTSLFDNTRRTIASLLASSLKERELREAVAAFRAYQVSGLRGFIAWAAAEAR